MLISSLGNTRSVFPSGIDIFSTAMDGTSLANVINAEIWDKIETSIFRTQTYAKSLLHVASRHLQSNFKRITTATTGFVAAPALTASFDIVLSAPQMLLLSSSPFRFMNSLYAHVYAISGTQEPYEVSPFPVSANTV